MATVTRSRDGWLLVEMVPAVERSRALLLPGAQGSDAVFGPLLAEPALAAAGVRAIAANPPGFKGLPVPPGFDYRLESFAELVERVAAAEQCQVLVGHSLGANILIEVAARGRFRGALVLVSPALDRDAETKDLRTLAALSRNPLLRGPAWWLAYRGMRSAFKPYFTDPALLDTVTADARRIPRSVGRAVLLGYFDHLDRTGDLAARLAATTVPVIYLRGAEDDIGFTAAHRERLAANPRITVREIPHARHFAMCDRPAAVAAAIVEAVGATAA